MYNEKPRDSYAKFYPVIFPLLAFWDFYLGGVRLLDLFSFILLFLFLGMSFVLNGYRISFLRPGNLLPLNIFFGFCLLISLRGIISSDDNFKPVLGFISGTIIFYIFYISNISQKYFKYIIIPFFIISISFFYIQDIYYYISGGKILHPLYLIGEQPRALSSIFRPPGLYLEPANYCLTTIMLLLISEKYKILTTKIFLICALSILLSASLWGYGALIIFTFTRYISKSKTGLLIAASLLCLVAAGFLMERGKNPIVDFAVNRITNISSDSSAGARYGGIKLVRELGASDPSLWFGTGISNDYLKYGSNGLAFILNAAGILGTSLIFFLLVLLCDPENRKKFAFYFMFLLTAAPLWSVFFWWAWLALMLKNQDPLTTTCDARENVVL